VRVTIPLTAVAASIFASRDLRRREQKLALNFRKTRRQRTTKAFSRELAAEDLQA
jgi:hypothetical protein